VVESYSVIAAALDGSEFIVGPDSDHEGPAPLSGRNLAMTFGVHVGLTAVLSAGAHHHVLGVSPDAYDHHVFVGVGVVHVELVLCGDWDDRELTIWRETWRVDGILSQRDRLHVSEGLWVRNVNGGQSRTVFGLGLLWYKPGTNEPVPKQSYMTRIGDQGCGVGYYK
jgi:hypothetical protein